MTSTGPTRRYFSHLFDDEPTVDMQYSDGVPIPVGDGGASERDMPKPPVLDNDITRKFRKAR